MAVSVLGYEHTGVLYRDTKKAARWFCDHFGAEEVSKSEDVMPIIFLSFGRSSLLELVPAADSDNASPCDHAHYSLAVADLEVALKQLESAGIPLEKPVFEAYEGSPVAFFRDIEGNLWQLTERVSPLPLPWK